MIDRLLKMIRKRLSTDGERAAYDALLAEREISRNHQQGLRTLKDRGWSKPERINLGSGAFKKDGFLNLDIHPGGDLTLDLRRGLPFEADCCDQIFSEHFLEHLEYPGTIKVLLSECLRVLRPGGSLLLSVPDTEWPLSDYAQGEQAPYFRACQEHSWHPDSCVTRLEHINYHFRQEGEHRYAYDAETMARLLTGVGFVKVSKREFDPARDSPHRNVGSLFMTATKPGH